jgi:hypothetical protein
LNEERMEEGEERSGWFGREEEEEEEKQKLVN